MGVHPLLRPFAPRPPIQGRAYGLECLVFNVENLGLRVRGWEVRAAVPRRARV